MIKLAVFLGNPGPGYSHNRHNAGRLLAQTLPFYQSLSWQKKFNGLYVSYEDAQMERRVHLLMPETYMNRSGISVQAAASFFKINIEEIIIIHDELELPLGCISLKFSGGLGGHNGLRSMKDSFGNADFWRIRIGIGRPDSRLPGEGGPAGSGEGIIDWVLADFTKTELEILNPTLEAGGNLLTQIFSCEPETLLKEWAKKKILISEPAPQSAPQDSKQEQK
ncbi:MAG: aminoacyl-tRNA hydrolase [Treponema sp.]|jgi:PTH1 family peptidyl-tRNA hydrolase|nr:aminoacyl-tRNA hydrolase [Treponema sp.]